MSWKYQYDNYLSSFLCCFFVYYNRGSGKENNSNTSNNTTGAYDLGELDQALFLYLDGQTDHEQLRRKFFFFFFKK